MKVGLDFTAVLYQRGVSRYTHNLLTALTRVPQVKLALYGSSLRQKEALNQYLRRHHLDSLDHAIQGYPPSMLSLLWQFGFNSVSSQLPGIEVFHSWDWLQPPDKHIPLVSTIHDLAILKFPETAHPQILKMHQRSWEVLKKRNAHIIAVSQATRHDVISLLGFPADHVHVIYEALPIETKTIAESISEEKAEAIKRRYQLDEKFILFVGTREPRKNLERLITAWLPLANQYKLLIAGESGWDDSSSLLRQAPPNRLQFLGKVDDQSLSMLYAEAELLAYPSLYEGFGLPILEAFHHGTPVLTSNISSMPEVAGNAAVLVDPLSVEDIRDGMSTLLQESATEQKIRLQKMIIRLHAFSWQRVADDTAKVYQRAIETHT
jgi:glycosyltransferase involved in cell wall biosynthesis